MDIVISKECRADELVDLAIEDLVLFALKDDALPKGTELSISFVTDERIASLNAEFRGIDQPTDVLSFECDGYRSSLLKQDPRSESTHTDVSAAPVDSLAACAGDEASARSCAASVENAPPFVLGDIIIAPDVAYRRAEEFGNTFEDEICLLVVHGLLHLCGYDHIDDEDALIMQKREKDILSRWKNEGR